MQYIVQKYIAFTWPYPYSFGIAGWPSNRFKKICLIFQERALQCQGCPQFFYCANCASGVRAVENLVLQVREMSQILKRTSTKRKVNSQNPKTQSSFRVPIYIRAIAASESMPLRVWNASPNLAAGMRGWRFD